MLRGEIWWAELGEPAGSEPGYRRPVLIMQSDSFNRSAINTVVCVAITSNLKLAVAPGNVRIASRTSGLSKASVVNISQVITLDKMFLTERVKALDAHAMQMVDDGLRLVVDL